MLRARIVGTGSSVPSRVLTNQDLEQMVDTSDAWIVSRSGIRERRLIEEGQCASDLALGASRQALEMAGLKPADLDLILVGTLSGDMRLPATACILQERLGAKNAAGFDISAACCGFIYGLSVAKQYIVAQECKRVLVVGVEILSQIVDWTDRNTCVLFGDAAGASVLVPTSGEQGILSSRLRSDGSLWDLLYIPAGGSKKPLDPAGLANHEYCIRMKGNETFKHAVRCMADVTVEALREAGLGREDVNLLIPHQANLRIIEALAKRFKLPMQKVYLTIEKYGNTSSATIPVALDEANRSGALKANDLLVMTAFGGGLTWGATVVRW